MVKNIGISEFESLICYYKPVYTSIFILEKTIHQVGDVIKWDVACNVSGTVYFQNNQQSNSVICKSGHVVHLLKTPTFAWQCLLGQHDLGLWYHLDLTQTIDHFYSHLLSHSHSDHLLSLEHTKLFPTRASSLALLLASIVLSWGSLQYVAQMSLMQWSPPSPSWLNQPFSIPSTPPLYYFPLQHFSHC